MSTYVSNGAGTNFNTAANWDKGINTPSIHASTNITVSSGGVFSAAFTAPNLVNAATGVVVPVAAKGTAGSIVATLQEFNGAAWADVVGATATVTITNLVASTKVFFKFTTPYVFTTLTAGYYRIKLNTSGASGTTSIAADSGAANFSYTATDNENAVPGAGDDILIISPNQGAELAITLDTSPTFGSGTNTSTAAFRTWGNAVDASNGGILEFTNALSRTATIKGHVLMQSGGGVYWGRTGAEIPIGMLARLQFDENGVTGQFGVTKLTGGLWRMYGEELTFKKSIVVSGVGTAASPLVLTDAVDWSVGDEVMLPPATDSATNYNESETRFVITKNSTTSYVLSTTAGGAEAALTYSHVGGECFNMTRPCLIDTTDITKAWYCDNSETSDVTKSHFQGSRFETWGSTTTGKTSLTFSNLSTELFEMDDCVFYRGLAGFVIFGNNNAERTFTWLIGYDYNGTGNAGLFEIGSFRNKRYENCYVVDSQSSGFFCIAASTDSFVDCRAWACGRASATAYGGFTFLNSSNASLLRCQSDANRSYGFYFSTMAGFLATDCESGTEATNGSADVFCASDGYVTAVFENGLFGSSTLISNYLNATPGSEVAFHKYNQTENDHRWYTAFGSARSCGVGLADTNVRTADSLAVRIAPEDSTTGFYWDFLILARANSAVQAFGFIQKNAAFGTDDVTVELYLPGLVPGVDTPSDSYPMADDTSWNPFFLGADHTGDVPLFATVRIVAKSVAAGAYAYVDDLFNGTNLLIGIDTWYKGKPAPIMYPELGDPDSVWAVLTETQDTPGTMGKKHVDGLTRNQFLALK